MNADMSLDEALEIFRKYDDPVNWEGPAGFNYPEAIEKFKQFHAELEGRVNQKLPSETEGYIQDASFHSQINLGTNHWLRFSSFGNMVSVYDDESLDSATLDAIKQLAKERGYIYIPSKYAELEYDGANPGVTGIQDWWIRYFDWV